MDEENIKESNNMADNDDENKAINPTKLISGNLFDENNLEDITEELLGEGRRSSDGIIPTPMKNASFFSKYITIW